MTEQDEGYWKLVEPIWDQVNIYDGADIFLSTYATTDQPAGAIYAATLLSQRFVMAGSISSSRIAPASYPQRPCKDFG